MRVLGPQLDKREQRPPREDGGGEGPAPSLPSPSQPGRAALPVLTPCSFLT